MLINYFSDGETKIPRIRRQIIRQWVEQVVASYGKKSGELSYMFTDLEGILTANRQFLNHDYYTDVITFDGHTDLPGWEDENEGTICGDIFICPEVIRSNAQDLGVSYPQELHRVLIHGVLHLCGLDDHTPEDEQAMRQAEENALQQLSLLLAGKPYLQ